MGPTVLLAFAQGVDAIGRPPAPGPVSLSERLMGLVGIAVLILIAYALSQDRKAISWRLVGMALLLQLVFAVVVLKTTAGVAFFRGVGAVVDKLLAFTAEGARFVFGNLVGFTVPVAVAGPGGTMDASAGFVAQTGLAVTRGQSLSRDIDSSVIGCHR